jgi:hypothetical protein
MTVHYFMHHCKPDPGALERGGRMQALKRLKELARPCLVEAHPVVADDDGRLSAGVLGAAFDARASRLGGELQAVADQVFERDAHQGSIGIDTQLSLDVHVHLTV